LKIDEFSLVTDDVVEATRSTLVMPTLMSVYLASPLSQPCLRIVKQDLFCG